MKAIGMALLLRVEDASGFTLFDVDGPRLGFGMVVHTGDVTFSPQLAERLDGVGHDPGDVAALVMANVPPYAAGLDAGEAWDLPHRTMQESFELVARLWARANIDHGL